MTQSSKPSSYCKQNGCRNCKYVFVKKDYDEGRSYFCTLNAPERPDCGSVGMDEAFSLKVHCGKDRFMERMMKWDGWANDRKVESYGICIEWELSKNE